MMNKIRAAFFLLLIAMGSGLSWKLCQDKPQTRLNSTLAPAYQIAGRVSGSINKALSKVIPIDELDEKEYGDIIALRFESRVDSSNRDFIYLNDLIGSLRPHAKKPFSYRVFVLAHSFPNAFALPGGVILVTRGLLTVMEWDILKMNIVSAPSNMKYCFGNLNHPRWASWRISLSIYY
jgi:hypothetical protein